MVGMPPPPISLNQLHKWQGNGLQASRGEAPRLPPMALWSPAALDGGSCSGPREVTYARCMIGSTNVNLNLPPDRKRRLTLRLLSRAHFCEFCFFLGDSSAQKFESVAAYLLPVAVGGKLHMVGSAIIIPRGRMCNVFRFLAHATVHSFTADQPRRGGDLHWLGQCDPVL